MPGTGGFAVPGQGDIISTTEREILWGQDDSKLAMLWRSAVISGATRDAGNTPTTVLRPGLLLGIVAATGLYKEFNADLADGTQYCAGVLWKETLAQDLYATNTDRAFGIITRAPLRAGQLLIEGSALVGHVDEFIARQHLRAGGCVLDDDPQGYLSGLVERYETVTGTTDVLTSADNGKTLFYSNAAAVAVTLPAAQPGLAFDIIRTADEEIVVASPTADNIIVGNDLSADSVTFTTAGQQIGARLRFRSVYVSTTVKWICDLPNMPFGTGLTGGFAYSIATA